jgi:hypothetical protein
MLARHAQQYWAPLTGVSWTRSSVDGLVDILPSDSEDEDIDSQDESAHQRVRRWRRCPPVRLAINVERACCCCRCRWAWQAVARETADVYWRTMVTMRVFRVWQAVARFRALLREHGAPEPSDESVAQVAATALSSDRQAEAQRPAENAGPPRSAEAPAASPSRALADNPTEALGQVVRQLLVALQVCAAPCEPLHACAQFSPPHSLSAPRSPTIPRRWPRWVAAMRWPTLQAVYVR